MKKLALALLVALFLTPTLVKADPVNENTDVTNTPAANGGTDNRDIQNSQTAKPKKHHKDPKNHTKTHHKKAHKDKEVK